MRSTNYTQNVHFFQLYLFFVVNSLLLSIYRFVHIEYKLQISFAHIPHE